MQWVKGKKVSCDTSLCVSGKDLHAVSENMVPGATKAFWCPFSFVNYFEPNGCILGDARMNCHFR